MKFLTDAQTNILVVRMLQAIGWEVETVYDHGLDHEPDDARLVAWARDHGFVLLSFDEFRKDTRIRVDAELRERGGRVITVGGGPQQPPERAVGRLLFHHPEWYPWLSATEGRVHISDTKHNSRMLARGQERSELKVEHEPHFDAYLQRRAATRQGRSTRRRKRAISDDQGGLGIETNETPGQP